MSSSSESPTNNPLNIDHKINDRYKIKWSANGSLDDILSLLLGLSSRFNRLTEILHNSQDEFSGNTTFSLEYEPKNKLKVFTTRGFAIDVEKFSIDFTAERISSENVPELIFRFNLQNLEIHIGHSGEDGFINKLLSGNEIQGNLDFTVGWSSQDGIFLDGGGGLEITIPVHEQLGPIYIQALHIRPNFIPSNGIQFDISFLGTFETQLGPISALVERLGIKFGIEQNDDSSSLDVNFYKDFIPPTGAEISIKSGLITGAGFLRKDEKNHRYDGILQLDFGKIALTAIGLITTRLPDETLEANPKRGFSMLMMITAEFDPPLALAYNFYLAGVGGLIGINRSMNVDYLRDGVKNGTLDSILFPQDPIANASRIISDMHTAFPPAEGRYVFSPMAKILWNNPPIFTGDIGVLVEVPSPYRIALIGQLEAILPQKEKVIVEIYLDIFGSLDFDKKELSIDASLCNSKILNHVISGDSALRLNWGNQPQFGFSCGGFHPKAKMPPKFPSLRRLGISIGSGNDFRLNLDSYLAITSNSFQFGARLEVYASKWGFSIEGSLHFDTLFIFNPFSFTVDIGASVALKRGRRTLMSVLLEFTLSGPTQLRVKGYVSFRFLFLKIEIKFDKSWGQKREIMPPEIDAWPLLSEALNRSGNWAGVLPLGKDMIVSLREKPKKENDTTKEEKDEIILVHPMGALEIRQTVLPLDITLQKIGTAPVSGKNKFSITSICKTDTDCCFETTSLKEHFAPCQFHDCSNAEKLSKTFEKFNAGIKVSSDQVAFDSPKSLSLEYESKVIDERNIIHTAGLTSWSLGKGLLMGCATMQNPLHTQGVNKFIKNGTRPRITLREEEFVIANTSNLSIVEDLNQNKEETTFVQSQQRLDEHLAAHPEDRGNLQVIPVQEVA